MPIEVILVGGSEFQNYIDEEDHNDDNIENLIIGILFNIIPQEGQLHWHSHNIENGKENDH